MNDALSMSLLTRVAAAAVIWGAVAASPSPVWQVRGEGWGTPAADDTSVYFTTKNHEVVAVDLDTGRERWRAVTDEPGADTFGYGTKVAGSVVAAGDYAVVAFDRATGARKWRFDPAEGHAPGPFMGAVANGVLLTGSGGGRLHALEHDTGALKWSAPIVSAEHLTTVFAPIVHQNLVLAGFTEFAPHLTSGGVAAVELDTGKIRWKRPFPVPDDPTLNTHHAGGPVVHGGSVFAASGDGNIYAISIASGEIEWSVGPVSDSPRPHIFDPRRDFRALAVSGSTLVAGSLTGVVVGVDLERRTERWRAYDEWLLSAVMAVSADEDTVYLPFFSGELVAFDATTGAERWRVGDWKAGFIWAPLVWKNRLFVCATREGLFAFPRSRAVP